MQTRGGKTTAVNVAVFKKPTFKKGPNPEPERKDGKKGSDGAVGLSAEELVKFWAMGGSKEITLPPDGEFVRQLRTEDHFRWSTRMVQGLINKSGGTHGLHRVLHIGNLRGQILSGTKERWSAK